MRVFWLIGGFVSLALGGLGVVLPLVPTVPFVLLAAFCFARSSEKLHSWLLSHPTLGPMIADWQEKGAIRPKAKRMAVISIAAVFTISLIVGLKPIVLLIQAVVLSAVCVFILSRPDD